MMVRCTCGRSGLRAVMQSAKCVCVLLICNLLLDGMRCACGTIP